jgi:hypothetical protein
MLQTLTHQRFCETDPLKKMAAIDALVLMLVLLAEKGLTTTVEVIDFSEAIIENTFSNRREGKIPFLNIYYLYIKKNSNYI